jgi:hypothetical protein
MRSDSAAHTEPEQREAVGLSSLLDSVFGFAVWALHLLVVYVASAVACQLGLASQSGRVQSVVVGTLCTATLAAAALVVWHGIQRYRQRDRERERGFLARIAVGHDAVAALAILWQLMPLFMVPLCR